MPATKCKTPAATNSYRASCWVTDNYRGPQKLRKWGPAYLVVMHRPVCCWVLHQDARHILVHIKGVLIPHLHSQPQPVSSGLQNSNRLWVDFILHQHRGLHG